MLCYRVGQVMLAQPMLCYSMIQAMLYDRQGYDMLWHALLQIVLSYHVVYSMLQMRLCYRVCMVCYRVECTILQVGYAIGQGRLHSMLGYRLGYTMVCYIVRMICYAVFYAIGYAIMHYIMGYAILSYRTCFVICYAIGQGRLAICCAKLLQAIGQARLSQGRLGYPIGYALSQAILCYTLWYRLCYVPCYRLGYAI